jgi:uncharacterized RDD family membrane protein YckC
VKPPPGQAARPASLWRRGFAYLLDCAILYALLMGAIQLPLAMARGWSVPQAWLNGWVLEAHVLATISLPAWLWLALWESRRGGAPGKLALGLRVADASSGGRIGFRRALARTGVKLAPWEVAHAAAALPWPVALVRDPQTGAAIMGAPPGEGFRWGFALSLGLLAAWVLGVLLSKSRRAPHDRIAGTLVVREKP